MSEERLSAVYDIRAMRYPRGFRAIAHKLRMEPGKLAWLVFYAMAQKPPHSVVFIERAPKGGGWDYYEPWFRVMLEREQELKGQQTTNELMGVSDGE